MAYLYFLHAHDLTKITVADTTKSPVGVPEFMPGTRGVGDFGFYQYVTNVSTACAAYYLVNITPTLVTVTSLPGATATTYYDYRIAIVSHTANTTVPYAVGCPQTTITVGSSYKTWGWVATGPGLFQVYADVNNSATADKVLYPGATTDGTLQETSNTTAIQSVRAIATITNNTVGYVTASNFMRQNV